MPGPQISVDCWTLNKALNTNVDFFFFPMCLCVVLPPSAALSGSHSLPLRLSLCTCFKNCREVHAVNYENVTCVSLI